MLFSVALDFGCAKALLTSEGITAITSTDKASVDTLSRTCADHGNLSIHSYT
jgi:hypothetical protein